MIIPPDVFMKTMLGLTDNQINMIEEERQKAIREEDEFNQQNPENEE
jgi:hypothetical protein